VSDLGHRDLRDVLDLAQELSELDEHQDLVHRALLRIPDLIPGDVVGYNRVDLGQRSVQVLSAPDVPQFREPTVHLSETMQDHPLIQHWAAGSDPLPRRVSDLCSSLEWRRTSTYNLVLRQMGTPHLLGVPVRLAGHLGEGEGYAVARSGRDFSHRDCEVAAALQLALVVLHRRISAGAGAGRGVSAPVGPLTDPLTEREREVLSTLAEGLTAQAIGRRLDISAPTVRKHLERVYRKLGATDRLTAVNRARRLGLVE